MLTFLGFGTRTCKDLKVSVTSGYKEFILAGTQKARNARYADRDSGWSNSSKSSVCLKSDKDFNSLCLDSR